MTKKIFAMFLAVLMVLSVLPVSTLAAEANCPGKGSNKHTLDNCAWTVVKVTDPTCGANGYTSYKCNTCGDVFAASYVPATGAHTMVAGEAKAPTCGAPGYEAGTKCSVCGFEVPGKEIAPLHKLGTPCEWVDKSPAIDCTTGGTKVWECASCGARKTEEIKPGDHTWDNENPEVVTAPTASANGLAKVTCTTCKAVKDVVIYFNHTCVKVKVEGKANSCTEDGLKTHWVCRVCDNVYLTEDATKPATAKQIAALVIPAAHDYAQTPTCLTTTVYCNRCEKYIPVNTADLHEFKDENWEVLVPKSCTLDGSSKNVCSVCHTAVQTRIDKAEGHKSVTVSVPATCGTYAYSFTYCTYAGCVDGLSEAALTAYAKYDLKVDSYKVAYMAEPTVNQGFYLASSQTKLGTVLYFTGEMDGNYLATSNDVSKAAVVFLEIVHPLLDNQYRLYFFNAEGEKTYIEIYEYDTQNHKVGVHLTDAPTNAYNWDDELNNVLTCTLNNTEYYLNTYNTFSTISASKLSYISNSYPAYLCEVGVKAVPNVVSVTVNEKAGYNAQNHELMSEIKSEPTCKQTGIKVVYCNNPSCDYQTQFIDLPMEHRFEAVTSATVKINGKDVAASRPVDCEDGWQYFQCVDCQTLKKVTYAGYGHKWGETVEVTPDHKNTVVYDYYECVYGCGKKVETTRKTWGDQNRHWDDLASANKAHGFSLSGTPVVIKKGSCTEYGLEMYTCPDCGLKVYVKIAGTGEHVIPEGTDRKDPTCTEKGWIATYKCARCNAVIGKAALGEKNEIPALGHDWKEIKGYKAADHFAPNYNNEKYECARCHEKKTDGTKLILRVEGTNPCVDTTFEYYLCYCGQEHMISYISKLGHEMYEADPTHKNALLYKAPTCYAEGFSVWNCQYCDYTENRTLAKTEHVNAAGEKFTEKCTDTTADRHCVECHKVLCTITGSAHDCTKKDKDGNYTCACMIPSEHHGETVMMPSTCASDAYTMFVCVDCGLERVTFANMGWNGHRPEASDGNEYAAYTYLPYTWKGVKVENGKFVADEATYTAKFIEFVAPTYTSAGYWKAYCQDCKMVVTQILDKKEGLGVELTVANANGVNEVTQGSLIALTVSLNSLNTGIYGFNLAVEAPKGAVLVGSELLTEDFIVVSTARENMDQNTPVVAISGYAANDANGKMQNVVINANTEIITLYFRLLNSNSDFVTFNVSDAEAFDLAHFNDANKGAVYASDATANVKYAKLFDFNRDGSFHVTDIYTAMGMLTGESNKTYDVTVDFDKDGEITLYDLSSIFNAIVGNVEEADWLLDGVDADEAAFLKTVLPMFSTTKYCNNSACRAELPAGATFCPVCGNHQ